MTNMRWKLVALAAAIAVAGCAKKKPEELPPPPMGTDVQTGQAQWLARYPNVRVTVEGHADERGTREYNLALGDRRANAAKNYLATRGVSPSRMTVISWGKERPMAEGSNESAWAQNRRAVTVIPE